MQKIIEVEYDYGTIVYLRSDSEKEPRIITGYEINSTGFTYRVECGVQTSYHYGFELTDNKDELLAY